MLELKDICVSFRSERQDRVFGHTRQQVLFDVSLSVKKGTCLGILGESGSGKSMSMKAAMGLLDKGFSVSGAAMFQGEPLLEKTGEELRRLRGGKVLSLIHI